jgi:hypothetical protein
MVLTQKSTWKQCNRVEDPDMNPCCYVHLIFHNGAQNIRSRKYSLFKKCCWQHCPSACKKLKLDPLLSPCININSKWIKELNVRPETLKLVQKRVGNI